MSAKPTRQEFIRGAGAGAAWIALLGALGCEPSAREQGAGKPPSPANAPSGVGSTPVQPMQPAKPGAVSAFRSRPDLTPPTVEVRTEARDTAPGYIFASPKKGDGQDGVMIVDDAGELVWFRRVEKVGERAMDFKVQSYQGQPVLTWAEGKVVAGWGLDEYTMLDTSYREITRVRAGNGYTGDHHEFFITSRDTALFTIYNRRRVDLSASGGVEDREVVEGMIQEVDIESGEVLFEWHSLDHIAVEESVADPSDDFPYPFDYFHINSIQVEPDGNLLVSARRTSAVYKIDRQTGEVIWRLGGERSDFEMGEGTLTQYQHHARRQDDGTISIFDNGGVKTYEQSRTIVLRVDEDAMTITLVRQYTHPDGILAATQGSMQALPNANVFVGWGSEPVFSEFSSSGELLFDASFPSDSETYRTFRLPWTGKPGGNPAVVAERASSGEVSVYASWNGATEISDWEILAGPSPSRMKALGSVPRAGFETPIAARTAEPYIAARARDGSGGELGVSRAVRLEG